MCELFQFRSLSFSDLFLSHFLICLQFLIKSTTDSNGVPGRGLVLFIDLYSRLHKKYFDFIAANKALQHKVRLSLPIVEGVSV